MKFKYALVATVVAILSGAVSAQASSISLDPLSIGDTGKFVTTAKGGSENINDSLFGTLPADSEITIKFKYTGFGNGYLSDMASYTSGTGGFSVSQTPGTPHTFSTPGALVATTAHLGAGSGKAVITNYSSGVASFLAMLSGILAKGGRLVVSYSVSAVPLPSAATLLGLGLAMFAGFGVMKRKQARVAV